ncbi:hypothetical protein WA158_000449 [Blastocystis sp. Blastoise]
MLNKSQKKRVPVRSVFHHVMRSKLYGVLTINSMEGLLHELDNLLPIEMEKDNIDPFSFENRRYQGSLFPSSHGDHLDRALKSLGKDLGLPVSIDLVNTQAVKKVIMSIAKNASDDEKQLILDWLNMPNEVIMKSQRYQDFINQACLVFYKKPVNDINEDTVGFIRRSANELLRNKASKEALRKRLMKPDEPDVDMKLDEELLKSLSPNDTPKVPKMMSKYMEKQEDVMNMQNSIPMAIQSVQLPVNMGNNNANTLNAINNMNINNMNAINAINNMNINNMNALSAMNNMNSMNNNMNSMNNMNMSNMPPNMLPMPQVTQHIQTHIPVITMSSQSQSIPLSLGNPIQSMQTMNQMNLSQHLQIPQSMSNNLSVPSMHHDLSQVNMTMNSSPQTTSQNMMNSQNTPLMPSNSNPVVTIPMGNMKSMDKRVRPDIDPLGGKRTRPMDKPEGM